MADAPGGGAAPPPPPQQQRGEPAQRQRSALRVGGDWVMVDAGGEAASPRVRALASPRFEEEELSPRGSWAPGAGAPRSSARAAGSARAHRLLSQHTVRTAGAASAATARTTALPGGDTYMGDDAATTVHYPASEAGRGGRGGACPAAARGARAAASGALLLFCLTYTSAAIFASATTFWSGVPPWATYLLMWLLIGWLAVLEGSQVPIISLARGDAAAAAELAAAHPRARAACRVCHGDGMLERYLLGREFLKLVSYFLIAKATKVRDGIDDAARGDRPLALPAAFASVGQTGLMAAPFIVILGQLMTTMVAARAPAQFLALRPILPLAVYPSRAVEATGLLHVAYAVKWAVDVAVHNPRCPGPGQSRSRCTVAADQCRLAGSVAVWGFGTACVMYELWRGWDNGPFGVSGFAGIVVFIVLWFVLSFLDGLQVAATAAGGLDPAQLSVRGAANCALVDHPEGLQSYFIGKQAWSAVVRFCLITMATCSSAPRCRGETVFNMPDQAQEIMLETGLMGAVVVVVGPLAARLLAATFPGAYLGVPILTRAHVRACFLVDRAGVVSCCWALADALFAALRLRPNSSGEAAPLRDAGGGDAADIMMSAVGKGAGGGPAAESPPRPSSFSLPTLGAGAGARAGEAGAAGGRGQPAAGQGIVP